MWNEFDNSMQHDGGGFMDDSQAQATQPTEQGDRNRMQNIVPLFIGHLNNATETELKLWGTPVKIVTVVALVRKIEQVTTKVTYELEDETGTITAIQWLEADKPNIDSAIKLNAYARCYGFLRESTGLKHIMIVRILPVTEIAEVLMHLCEITAISLMAAKAKNQVLNSNPAEMSNAVANFNDTEVSGLTREQSTIFNIIKADNDSDCGIDRNTIKRRVPGHMVGKVDEILNFLSNEGHIYTTSTDDNFKTT